MDSRDASLKVNTIGFVTGSTKHTLVLTPCQLTPRGEGSNQTAAVVLEARSVKIIRDEAVLAVFLPNASKRSPHRNEATGISLLDRLVGYCDLQQPHNKIMLLWGKSFLPDAKQLSKLV